MVCNLHMEARPSSLFLPLSAIDNYYGGEGANGLHPPHQGQALQPSPLFLCTKKLHVGEGEDGLHAASQLGQGPQASSSLHLQVIFFSVGAEGEDGLQPPNGGKAFQPPLLYRHR
jgi:hypothetical protein